MNYGSIGSHTLQDAGANARNHISKRRRFQNMRQVQQINRNQVGLPNTSKQLGSVSNILENPVFFNSSTSLLAFAGGLSLMALTKSYDTRLAFGTGAQTLALGGIASGAYQYFSKKDATLVTVSSAATLGLIIGANLFKVKLAPGPVRKIARDFRALSL